MEKSIRIFFIFLFISLISIGNAQSIPYGGPIPLKPLSPSFGADVFINNQSLQDQRNTVICSAFNGWLYAAYSYFDTTHFQDAFTILRSEDDGANWSILIDAPLGTFHQGIPKMAILASGHDTGTLKVFLGIGIYDSLYGHEHILWIIRFDKNGIAEYSSFPGNSDQIRDFAMASDDLYPANSSNPFSLGVVYSKGTYYSDSIVFLSSSNGGMSFDSQYRIASTSNYFDKVALAYGRSPSNSSGRYFAAWEEKNNANSTSGHIYTAHSEPNFNSPFTTPVLIDTLDVTASNLASNPVVACQNNATDNDSSNLTEVVLFDKYISANHNFNIGGFYNKKATNSNNFRKLTIDASSNNKIQPSICFNAFDSTFIVTYFDSTSQKLPYYIHNFNMNNPDSWNEISSGYNDYNNLVAPYPQVVMDFDKRAGANAWTGIRGNGNGVATFDSPFTYYLGNSEQNDKNQVSVNVYPNPASNFAILEYYLPKEEKTTISLVNSMGQTLANISDPSIAPGKHSVKVDLTNYPAGMYLFMVNAGDSIFSGKIVIQ